MSKRKQMQIENALSTGAAFSRYYQQLCEMALSRFKWNNIPDEVNSDYLERTLLLDGHVCFSKDETIGFYALPCTISAPNDVYGVGTRYQIITPTYYHAEKNRENAVIIYANSLRTAIEPIIYYYAKRLTTLDRIIEINANAQKTPLLITCDENMRLTMVNVYNDYNGNIPAIFGNKNLTPNSIEVLKTDAPYIADKINLLKKDIWSEALTYLGISNFETSKKERAITGEVTRSMGSTISMRNSELLTRQECAKKINNMFGLAISVSYNPDYDDIDLNAIETVEVEE